MGIRRMYDDGIGSGASISPVHFAVLVLCSLFTGLGAVGGLLSALSTTAKSFPKSLVCHVSEFTQVISHALSSQHATATGLVLSGFGLSAFFFSTIAHFFFAGDTSALLNLLALTTSIPMLIALFVVRSIPLPETHPNLRRNGAQDCEAIPSGESSVGGREQDSSTPLLGARSENSGCLGQSSSITEIGHTHTSSHPRADKLSDIHGLQLFVTSDFYLILSIMSLCEFCEIPTKLRLMRSLSEWHWPHV